MPFLADDDTSPQGLPPQLEPPRDAPRPAFWRETVPAALSLNNSVVSVSNWAADRFRPDTLYDAPADPGFDPFDHIQGYEAFADSFVDADTFDDVARIKRRIDREQQARATLGAAGWQGVVAGIGAGVFDPINAIPVGGQVAKGLSVGRTAMESALATARAGALGSAAQTGVLYATQETKTPAEAVEEIGLGTVIAGALGGAAPLVKAAWGRLVADAGDFHPPASGWDYDTGAFAAGQTRSAADVMPFVREHVVGKPKGEHIPTPAFHLGGIEDAWHGRLARVNPDFAAVPPDMFVSGRVLKHIEEQRPGLLERLGGIDGVWAKGGRILPNPTAEEPWARPWLVIDLDPATALVAEVRANGRGIDLVNIIAPVERSRVSKAEKRLAALGINGDDLRVPGPEGRTLPSSSSASSMDDASRGLRFSDGRPGEESIGTAAAGGKARPETFDEWKARQLRHSLDYVREQEATWQALAKGEIDRVEAGRRLDAELKWTTPDDIKARLAELGEMRARLERGDLGTADDALRMIYDDHAANGTLRTVGEPGPGAGGSVGAALADDTNLAAETLKGALGVENLPGVRHQDPLIRLIHSPSLAARRIIQRLAENPLMMAKNAEGKASAVAVETRIKMWQSNLARAVTAMDDAFVRHRLGRERRSLDIARIGAADTFGQVPQGKLSRRQFSEEVARAMRRDDRHPVPEVAEAAAAMRREVFDPLKEQAIDLGLLPEGVSVETAASYLMRVYNSEKISARRHEWRAIVTRWLGEEQTVKDGIRQRVTELLDQHGELTRAIRKLEGQIEGRQGTLEKVEARREVASRLNQFAWRRSERMSEPLDRLHAEIVRIGEAVAPVMAKLGELADAIRAEKNLHPELKQIEATMYRLIGANRKLAEGREIIDLVEGVEDYARAIEEMRGGFAEGIKSARQQSRLARHALGLDDLVQLEKARADLGKSIRPYRKALDKATKEYRQIRERRIDQARGGAVFETRIRQEVNSLADQASGKAHAVGTLEAKLAEKQARLDRVRADIEKAVGEWNGNTSKGAKKALQRRGEKEASRSPDKPRLKEADKTVLKAARGITRAMTRMELQELEDLADEITDRILGTPAGRLPYDAHKADAGGGHGGRTDTRGPLKARTFAIPDHLIEDFLENDVDVLARIYTRTMATDTELVRQFGTTDLVDQLGDVRREYAQAIARADSEVARTKLKARMDADIRDLAAIRDRLRGTFALPANPDGMIVRASRVVRNINYLRLMGGMTISAIPDLGRAVMVHGFSRVFGDGLQPLLANMKGFKLAAEEARLAGAGLDLVLDSRAMQLADVWDDYGRHSKFERGVQALTNQYGLVTLMAPWNAAMKQFAGVVTQTRMLKAIQAVAAGHPVAAEAERLAFLGIDRDMAARIAEQFAGHGQKQAGGVLWANTLGWTDREAVDAFRAGVLKEVDRIIVTPGQDRPLWMSTELGKLIGQFKTFSLASTQRVALAALQQRDAAALNGTLLSVGLGMMSYATYSAFSGRDLSDDPKDWVVEGVNRSGVLFWLTDVMATGGKLAGFSGGSRYASRSSTEALLGPTLGAGLDNTVRVVHAGASGEWKAGDTRALRRLLPYQNLFFLRRVFDKAEEGLNDALGVPAR
ncbi:hypothetical protein [Magnetospirillum sp. UT-4]|uniref:hypothetical protein n=1 Tax=Magnetospirillum sp. UT-4 TaxID=2681467 RepID=UPI0013846F5F|nr:hypothetical protein [Magnetospirillum sp. UT-4]CAA7621196.1 hypothetical protein MTBUT4_380039 [Magnetospirillum sp. UT-4]